ncbi:MAG: glycosyltransferase [Flavobacteriaceae bacterium]|nr:glycosyltransferase [Flavobacteriaceae bacterium]
MKEKKKVLTVIVTYNRLPLLRRCIQHVSVFSNLTDILIINNSSVDGTEQYLIDNNIGHITQPNGGSSAGWWRGISEAQSRGYEYVWLMDDDGFPDKDALKILLASFTQNTACVSSVVVKENIPDELVFGMPKLNKKGNPVLFSFKRKYGRGAELKKKGNEYNFAHLFNGALISTAVTNRIGNVNREYFLYGDEVDYFCKLRNAGTVFTQLNALHYHPDVSQRNIEKARVYYFVRNTIILNKLYFDHRLLRDFFTVGIALLRVLRRNGFLNSLSYLAGKNLKYLFYGIKDGYRMKMIKRI